MESLGMVISNIPADQYSQALEILSESSIGQHFRHVIEFYLLLLDQQNSGVINYDLRKRQKEIEGDPYKANEALTFISNQIQTLEDKPLMLTEGQNESFNTSLKRELWYVYEHATHHMAIIKIGLQFLDKSMIISDNFGVADSTIAFNKTYK